jgi:hypothetical protein
MDSSAEALFHALRGAGEKRKKPRPCSAAVPASAFSAARVCEMINTYETIRYKYIQVVLVGRQGDCFAVAFQKIGIDNRRMLFCIYALPVCPVPCLARQLGSVGQAFA